MAIFEPEMEAIHGLNLIVASKKCSYDIALLSALRQTMHALEMVTGIMVAFSGVARILFRGGSNRSLTISSLSELTYTMLRGQGRVL